MSDNEKKDPYDLRRQEFIKQFESEIESLLNPEYGEEYNEQTKNKAIDNLGETFDIIWGSSTIEPKKDIKDNEIFFETDLHGDMRAFLNTLCETGAVKYKDGEDALIFYNPDVAAGEEETYTLDKLANLKTTDAEKHIELMKKLQPLANVVPTAKYSQYVNCGDFMDRGKQSEQMIHMINYLNGQCKGDIKPAKLIMGNHELFYIDKCSNGLVQNNATCIYGSLNTEKAKSLEKAVKKAVDSGTLVLAHSEGTTIFSHVVITKYIVKKLAENLTELAKERKNSTSSEPAVGKIKELAEKFTKFSEKISKNESFNKDDARNLAEGLNEFLSMRSKIFKDFNITPQEGLEPDNNSTETEKQLFNLMRSEDNGGITWNRIKYVKEDQLIPGLKYIVGHDAEEEYSSMEPSKKHGNKVILADCKRSSGYSDKRSSGLAENKDATKANYAIVEPEFLSGEAFAEAPKKIIEKTITKEKIAEEAKLACSKYLEERPKTIAKENAVVTKVLSEVTPAVIPEVAGKNDSYDIRKQKFIKQFESAIDKSSNPGENVLSNSEPVNEDEFKNKVKETAISNLSETFDIIWDGRQIGSSPESMADIKDGDIFFETDLHGDMAAFLNTLCEAGAVKYKDGEDALIFYNPDVAAGEEETYTLDDLDALITDDIEKHTELMEKLQPLANVVPTAKYSQYVNCGDFMDRGKQSEQMIHMINYLNGQCKDGIEPAKLIMGNHELFYLDSCYEGYAKSFSTNNGGNCIYGDFPLYSKKIYCKKAKSLEKAVKKAVDNGTLTLAYGKGTTIFSHVVITREMVTDLAQALIELAKERRGRTDSEPAAEKIDELAKKFTELSNKIGKNESFNENDASSLAKGLNEFLSMRSKIFKDFDVHNFEKYKEDPEKYYSIDVKPFTGLNPNNNSTEAEKKLFNLMNSGAIEKGITWNRIENVKKEDQLIPGLKYIVGHDADEKYRTMEPSKDHGERVILADSKRSSGYNSGETRANYAIIKPESLSREKFASDSAKPKEIVITKEATARGARTAYSEYSKKQPKTIAAEKPAVATKESPAKVIEGTAIDPAALTEEKPKKATTTVTEAKVIPEVIPQWLKKDDEYKLRRQEFIEQFESEIDRFSNPKDKREKAAFKKRAEDSLSETFDIIWSSRKVSPYIDRIKDNDTFFETDLNGDMAAFLNTLCDTKAVKYKDGEDALIFYNPDVAAGEEETYTLDKLAYLKTTDAEKHKKLMEKLQPLPNVVPTTRYSRYVNCGNFMGRGMQSEQMIHMINYLHGQCKDDIKPAKLIMGNHELSYLDRCPLNYIDEGNCIYGKLINKAKPIFKKAESLEKAVKKAVDNGALTLAHSQGTTIFSHTVITKSMVKDFAEALTELAKEKESSADSEPDVEKIKELAKKFTELSNKIKNNKLPFNEGDATNLAKGLNEFLSMRSKIFKKHFDSIKINPNLRFTGLSWNDDTYTKAETKLFNLMNSYGEKKGGITWNEIKNVPEDQLIPGLKYIVGHDAKKEYSSMEPSKEHGNKVILADCYRSYVFNDYKTRTNYAVIEPEFLSGKEFVSAPKITADTIIRYNIAEVAEKVYKQYMDEKETSEKSNATAVTEENKTEASEKLNATAVTTEKPPVVTEEDKTEGTREIKYVDKSYYKGDFSNGRKNGRGKFVYTDSSFYEGGFVNGIRRGNGMLVDKDKKYIFFGKWRETGKEMEGSRLNLESGIVETGTFKFKDSKGCEPLAEGTIIEFDSNISNDGNGTLENIRGALQNDSAVKFLCKDRNLTISQESSDNKKDLVIQINQSDKTVSLEEKAAGPEEESAEYSISYKDGKIFNGNTKMEYLDGSSYEGDFKNGRKNGKGKFIYTDKSFYEGDFVDGVRIGGGILVDKDKKYIFFGNWKEDGKEMDGSRLNLESGIVETGTFTFKDNKGCELAEEAKKDIANTKHIGDKSQKQNLGSIKKTLEENKNVKFSHGDENLKISYVEKSKQDPFIVDTGAAVDVSKLKFSEHVAIMTTTDVGNIEGQIRKWWSAAMSYNKDVNIPPDDTLSIGNRSINYKTFKKLVDDKILSETGNMEDAAKFNFNKNSINAIANSLMKADESGKYDIGLHDFKCHTIFADVEKAKEELWPPILDLIENQKNNKDNKMHIIVNRNIYYTDGTNTIDEEKNTNELRHTGFSIVCGGRCFVFETLGAIDLDKYIRTLPEEEQTSNKLEGNLFSTKSGIQKTTYDCNSITLGAIKNFIKSFTKDFGSDPELFSEYLSLFFSEKEQEFKTPFLFDEIVDTKKTEGRTAVYTGILPKEFFKYAQTVRGMNKVKEVIIEKLKETGIDDKKREALTKLGEKIDSINNKYVKAGLIKGCDNVYLPIGPQNMRARFERIKLLFDLGELENKGALDKSVLPTPKELAAKTANEKVKSRKALDFRNLTVSKIFKNIVEEAGKLAQADSNQARGKFREREGEKRKKNNAQEIKRS